MSSILRAVPGVLVRGQKREIWCRRGGRFGADEEKAGEGTTEAETSVLTRDPAQHTSHPLLSQWSS